VKAALGVVRVWGSLESAAFRKGAPCQLVATKVGPGLLRAFRRFPWRLWHGWLNPLESFVTFNKPASVVDESPKPRLSSAPAGVMAGFGGC